jgi:hypothetical protein
MGEWRYIFPPILTLQLDGYEQLDSRPGSFTSEEKALGTHLIGGWISPRDCLVVVGSFLNDLRK